VHAHLTKNKKGVKVGFEDLYEGGDSDFDDAMMQVKGAVAIAP
jgi:hypothetical protein